MSKEEWAEKREAGMERVNHFLDLKNGVVTERAKTGLRYIHVVSGGCAIALAESCFIDCLLDTQLAMGDKDNVLFVTNGDQFNRAIHGIDHGMYHEAIRNISVIDIHDIFRQKWHLQGAFWPIAYATDIRTGIFIVRPSDQKVCRVIGGCPGKVVLYELLKN